MKLRWFLTFACWSTWLVSCGDDDKTTLPKERLQLISVKVGTIDLEVEKITENVSFDKPLLVRFNLPLNVASVAENVILQDGNDNSHPLNITFLDGNKTISAIPQNELTANTEYTFAVRAVKSQSDIDFPGATYRFRTKTGVMNLISARVNGEDLLTLNRIQNLSADLTVEATFSHTLAPESDFKDFFSVGALDMEFELSEDRKTITLQPAENAAYLERYFFNISSEFTSENGFTFPGFSQSFYTRLDSTSKFPEIDKEELLTKIQRQTFKYFWDFAHPASGLARERSTSGETVTIGGSGFGVMAIIAGIERGFINKAEGVQRLTKIIDFLEKADRFHGAWPHWMNGTTGKTIPFSANDDGADLVETAFMIQSLLTVRQYLNPSVTAEAFVIEKINQLWNEVEWDWFTQNGQNVLYWHWSPNFGWDKDLAISGWNEALIVYILAASSPTYPISKEVYDAGWARNGQMQNGMQYYDISLPLGDQKGGPLFFAHYSFLGLDPRNLKDQYADYWQQNVNHTLINRAYCIDNPRDFVGYGETAWGLTASDSHNGYSAHSPINDLGVITPTASISSIPYSPEESINTINHFYYLMGDKLWGEYGFIDAYNVTESWYANTYLAIDQGPIIIMIENHRSGLFWNLFMSCPEIQIGLTNLNFTF